MKTFPSSVFPDYIYEERELILIYRKVGFVFCHVTSKFPEDGFWVSCYSDKFLLTFNFLFLFFLEGFIPVPQIFLKKQWVSEKMAYQAWDSVIVGPMRKVF